MLEGEKLFCRHCWVEVEVISEPARTVGKGEPTVWRHKYARTDAGHPNCGKRLTDEDLTDAIEADD